MFYWHMRVCRTRTHYLYPAHGQNSKYVRVENTVKSELTPIKNTTKKWQIVLDITTFPWYNEDNPKGHSKSTR